MPEENGRKYILVNPKAGRASRILKKLGNLPESIEIVKSSTPQETADWVESIGDNRVETVVLGGDGSLSYVMGALYGAGKLSQCSFLPVPAGTMNQIAHLFGRASAKARIDSWLRADTGLTHVDYRTIEINCNGNVRLGFFYEIGMVSRLLHGYYADGAGAMAAFKTVARTLKDLVSRGPKSKTFRPVQGLSEELDSSSMTWLVTTLPRTALGFKPLPKEADPSKLTWLMGRFDSRRDIFALPKLLYGRPHRLRKEFATDGGIRISASEPAMLDGDVLDPGEHLLGPGPIIKFLDHRSRAR